MIPARTCFLIEDDDDDQEIFMMALKEVNESVQCVTANDGVDALRKLADLKMKVDIIFLDLNMPRMNGKQFLSEIKRHEKFQTIPVVIYSTSSEPSDKEEVLKLGARDFITKPPYLVDLISTLSAFFSPESGQQHRN